MSIWAFRNAGANGNEVGSCWIGTGGVGRTHARNPGRNDRIVPDPTAAIQSKENH